MSSARSPFPLSQPAPTPDETNDEGRVLFLEFVHDRIVEEGIPEDELALEVQNDDTMNRWDRRPTAAAAGSETYL